STWSPSPKPSCCTINPSWPRPNPRPCATGCCTQPPASCTAAANCASRSTEPGPGQPPSPTPSTDCPPCPSQSPKPPTHLQRSGTAKRPAQRQAGRSTPPVNRRPTVKINRRPQDRRHERPE